MKKLILFVLCALSGLVERSITLGDYSGGWICCG